MLLLLPCQQWLCGWTDFIVLLHRPWCSSAAAAPSSFIRHGMVLATRKILARTAKFNQASSSRPLTLADGRTVGRSSCNPSHPGRYTPLIRMRGWLHPVLFSLAMCKLKIYLVEQERRTRCCSCLYGRLGMVYGGERGEGRPFNVR